MIQAGENGRDSYVPIDEDYDVVSRRKCRTSAAFIRFGGACFTILVGIIAWIIMAEKLQKVNREYRKPFFITYWVHGWGYSLLYIVWKIWILFPGRLSCNRIGEGALKGNARQVIILAALMSFLSFVSAYSWYYSLPRTNIPANTSIYQAACVWVFVFSLFLLRERLTVLKVIAVVVSVAGVILVAVYSNNCHKAPNNMTMTSGSGSGGLELEEGGGINGDSGHMLGHIHRGDPCSEKSTPLGYVALIFSVITYAFYQVSYKKWGSMKNDPAAVLNSARFVGYLGLNTLLWLWPFFFVLHYSGLERFEWPPRDIFVLLVWNALLDVVFNVGILICIALSSALFASIGTMLVIPGAVLVDWIVQGYVLLPLAGVGILLIIIGFAGFIASEVISLRLEAKSKSRESEVKVLQVSVCTCSTDKNEEDYREDLDESETSLLLKKTHRRRLRMEIMKYLF